MLELFRRNTGGSSGAIAAQRGRNLFLIDGALLLGFAFIAGQYVAWKQLAAQGLFLATNPNSSFFYLFTGMHIVHLFGGILALSFLLAIFVMRDTVRPNLLNAVVTYWHFMAVLWVYLLFIICTRL